MLLEAWGPLPSLAAFAARELGLFAALGAPADVATLCRVIGAWDRGVERLLPVLELGGTVVRDGDGRVRHGVVPPPEGAAPAAVELICTVLRRHASLAEADVSAPGALLAARQLVIPPDFARIQRQARAAAALVAPRFSEPSWALDLGCGLGLYSAALLEATLYPRVLLVDQAPVIEQAARFQRAFLGRLDFLAGDLVSVRLPPRRYRVAFLCDVLHTLSPEACAALVGRTAAVLDGGGCLLIAEWAEGSPLAALYALSSLLFGAVGGAHRTDDIRAWCAHAGLADFRSHGGDEGVVFHVAAARGP